MRVETAMAVVNRTPEIIAAEINSIKEQARIQILCHSIEIGRRLVEAKSLLPHGEWGKWLELSVDYSQSTANNLMRIAEEYGTEQWALFGADANSQALGNLSYTQAALLLGVPAEEREAFVQENDVEKMSTRELKQAIKERDKAIKDKQKADKKLENAQKIADQLQNQLKEAQDKSRQEIEKLQASIVATKKELDQAKADGNNDEVKKLQSELDEADAQLTSANEEISELNKQLAAKPIEVTGSVETIPPEVEEELERLRKQNKSAAAIKYTMVFNNLVNNFKELLVSLGEIKESDPDQHEKYTHATLELISKMSAKL